MSERKKIKSALISVYYKDNLDGIVKKLGEMGVVMYSTGGTQEFIQKLGCKVTAVEDLTSYPSILGGRVKTLHPKVFGGILGRRHEKSDLEQMKKYEIPEIDLVIVDLYPFEETVACGASHQEIIEKIDIGGISLIRAAAKNYKDVLIVSSREQYADLARLLEEKKGETDIEDRRFFAAKAFDATSHYDTAIFKYFNREAKIDVFKESIRDAKVLRYGENPHQRGIFFGKFEEMFDQLWGKEISYNNLLDIDAAVNLISDFNETTVAILKHNNACGIASRQTVTDAWNAALEADPVSAFGGIIICNKEIDKAAAEEMNKIFFEVVIAPSFKPEALEVLKQKKNRIILVLKKTTMPATQIRSALNGFLFQDKDMSVETENNFTPVTHKKPTTGEIQDLIFANKVVKHTKSNTIVLAKDNRLLASGTGQTSRVDALRQAIDKARSFNFDLNGAVMASDAFFPFPDCVEIAGKAGITAVVQPGGSINDAKSIEYCNANNIAMVTTGVRHFKH